MNQQYFFDKYDIDDRAALIGEVTIIMSKLILGNAFSRKIMHFKVN